MLAKRRRLQYFTHAVLLAIIAFARMQGQLLLAFTGCNEHQERLSSPSFHSTTTAFIGNDKREEFCVPWGPSMANNRTLQPFDVWFTHHLDWVVSSQTNDKFCVEPVGNIATHPHIRYLSMFYVNQFHSACDNLHVRIHWGSGWRADFYNMQGGLIYALNNRIPLVMYNDRVPWNYAANKDDSSGLTCKEGDTTCYFLPYHDCEQLERKPKFVHSTEMPYNCEIRYELGRAAYLFMTRKQLWLRRAVFDTIQSFKKTNNITVSTGGSIETTLNTTSYDCTVMHVRRSDVILDEPSTRRYFPVIDYVKLIPQDKLFNPNHHIFLLTDDSNAIDEANEFFPNLNWKYFDRPRHRGSSGGWENQTPSRNPAMEVIIILAIFELAQECSTIVHGKSGFADVIYEHMLLAKRPGVKVERYQVGSGEPVYNPNHNTSESELEKTLHNMRKNHSNGTD